MSPRADDYILLTISSNLVGDWCCMRASGKLVCPEFLARFCIECSEIPIIGGGHKNKAARRDNRSAEVGRAPFFVVRESRKTTQPSQRHSPANLPAREIDGYELAPRRRRARRPRRRP